MTGGEPIACALTGDTLKHRIAWIARLARDSLRRHQRDDLVLRLVYAGDAADRVRQMMRDEQACCAFLEFDLQQRRDEVLLTIKAPETARELVDDLFAHFVGSDTEADRN